ncbi:MAG: DUF2817 domain-containing protein [Candidatus Nanopelagicales bacterium]|nr:DUF2817 domain-containing protein [Candidatus Nanopelagicales bacterium]
MQGEIKCGSSKRRLGRVVSVLLLAASTVSLSAAIEPAMAGAGGSTTRVSEEPLPDQVLIGKSTRGRPILAKRQGDPNATRVLLVVGQMHGDEPKGTAVVRSLRKRRISENGNVAIWTVSTMNPDGQTRRTRVNARSVDLNRNFPTKWRRLAKGGTYSGPRPASEVETTAVMAFTERLRPDAIMSFHQPLDTVMTVCDAKARPWVRRIGRLAGLPVPSTRGCVARDRSYPGTLNKWFSAHFPGWFATVELPVSSVVNKSKIRRYTNTVIEISRLIRDRSR